jgi:peptidoglycan hydrolase-like protein with peptidoglycan-binding domain
MGHALKVKGYYKGSLPTQPAFTKEMARAVSRFQASNKLPSTGEPDQFTLFKLFSR